VNNKTYLELGRKLDFVRQNIKILGHIILHLYMARYK